MMDAFSGAKSKWAAGLLLAVAAGAVQGQRESAPAHGRKYKPMAPAAHVVITVQKGFNGKPLQNAAVIFHAIKDGKTDGNLEVKTDPEGRATIDLLEIGSHVTLQVLANGFATYATEFDLGETKEMTVKLERPKAQVSMYEDNDGKTAPVAPGIQEHPVPKRPNNAAAEGKSGAPVVPVQADGAASPGAAVPPVTTARPQ